MQVVLRRYNITHPLLRQNRNGQFNYGYQLCLAFSLFAPLMFDFYRLTIWNSHIWTFTDGDQSQIMVTVRTGFSQEMTFRLIRYPI